MLGVRGAVSSIIIIRKPGRDRKIVIKNGLKNDTIYMNENLQVIPKTKHSFKVKDSLFVKNNDNYGISKIWLHKGNWIVDVTYYSGSSNGSSGWVDSFEFFKRKQKWVNKPQRGYLFHGSNPKPYIPSALLESVEDVPPPKGKNY